MRDKKQAKVVEASGEKTPHARPLPPPRDNAGESNYLHNDQNEPDFSRELVLRLIDWVKHI
ncbi:MAG TPA: hypothetical protein VLA49_02780 [Anaerolineales bacterium]|nr:hypothetical protein [Anaerolineales bacterium]